jgi:hypothetical protein
MKILVLDTIHGGRVLAHTLLARGHDVDMVDVYRQLEGISPDIAAKRRYDVMIAPVHLDPGHPLLNARFASRMTHHEAVRWLLEGNTPSPMIEITGARGKTTTAYLLSSLMTGQGVLHTSNGTWRCPEKELLWKRSITPASVLSAAQLAVQWNSWLIAEESLGVSGAGKVGVLTSGEDYPIANGSKSALEEKLRSLFACSTAVIPPGVPYEGENAVFVDEAVSCSGERCNYAWNGIEGEFTNSLCRLEGYRTPLMVAATVACVLSIDPYPLVKARTLDGRMNARWEGEICVIDNANSGTNARTTVDAARYARSLANLEEITLVIGAEAENICEGFPQDAIRRAIDAIRPERVILVGVDPSSIGLADSGTHLETAEDLDKGLEKARKCTIRGSIVLAVKTWR